MISVAAELAGMHPQTLRIYEARGLITPKRSPKNTRLYSQDDVERLRRIQELTDRAGDEPRRAWRRCSSSRRRSSGCAAACARSSARPAKVQQELRAEIDRVRRSFKRELVLYEPPSQSLIGPGVRVPIRRPAR